MMNGLSDEFNQDRVLIECYHILYHEDDMADQGVTPEPVYLDIPRHNPVSILVGYFLMLVLSLIVYGLIIL